MRSWTRDLLGALAFVALFVLAHAGAEGLGELLARMF